MKLATFLVGAGALLLGLTISASPALAQAQAAPISPAPSSAGPWLGAWKSNPEKSAAANGRPAPQGPQPARIFRMKQVGKDAFYYTIETVPVNGGPASIGAAFLGRFDGKDYMEIGNAGADTNRFRIIDDHTYELIDTKDGKDLTSYRITISADGKTRTSVSGGKNAQGQPVTPMTSISDRIPE